jgi:hypothetical protein
LTIPYFVLTVVPSTIGRMSRWTPSRLTSGPCPLHAPPPCRSRREDDARLLDAIDRGARHAVHVHELLFFFLAQRVEGLGHRDAALARAALEQARQHVLDVDVHLLRPTTPAMISNDGNERSRTSISICLWSSRPSRSCSRSFSRVRLACSRIGRRVLVELRGGRQRRQQQIEHALLRRDLRLLPHLRRPLLAHELHRDLGQIADHRLDVAPDVSPPR